MALVCKTDDPDLTTSVMKTLNRIDLSSTQCPTRQNEEPTSRPTNESLPVEVWMQIFEHVHIEDYARQAVVAVYRSSVAVYGDSIKAAEPLPPFEKRTWKRIRGLYHIDRNSRAAALKLNMCLRGLQECRGPSLAAKRLARVAQLMRRGLLPNLLPNYVAISVSARSDVLFGYKEAGIVVDSLSGTRDDVVSQSLGLDTAKNVVLLEHCNWDTYSMLARAQEIECAIYEFWRRNKIPAGVVEIV